MLKFSEHEKCLVTETKIDKTLKEMLATLTVIPEAVNRQKNVNIYIKSEVLKLVEAMEVIQQKSEQTKKVQASILT